jgi:hypothetical protein
MDDRSVLLEQYKLYVEMMDRTSARRAETNKFYISLLSALLAFMVFITNKKVCPEYLDIIMLAFCFLGVLLNVVWFINILSYKQLNSGKFKIIHKMEQELAYECYKNEWDNLKRGKDTKHYRKLTKVELFIPAILAVPYLSLLIYFLFK